MPELIDVNDIVYDSTIYPREKWNSSVVKDYMDVIKSGKEFDKPLILEKETKKLLDGKHRLTAYQKYIDEYNEAKEQDNFNQEEWATPKNKVEVEYHEIPDGIPAYLYALSLSAKHGFRIENSDKKANARRTLEENPDFNINTLAEYIGISNKTASNYVADLIAKRKEEQKFIAYRLYLLGWTQEEIGESIGITQQGYNKQFLQQNGNSENIPISCKNSLTGLPALSEFGKLESQVKEALDSGIPHLDVAERFNMPLILVWAIDLHGKTDQQRLERLNIPVQPYDVWNFAKCNDLFGAQHPGRIPGQLIAHVLYFFTEPGDFVIDPMVGSGTTIDICLAMNRKCYGYDIDKRHGRFDVIVHNWIESNMPERIKKAKLIFLDPPYFNKKDGENEKDGYIEGSISRLNRTEYLEFFSKTLKEMKSNVKPGTKLAFLMSDWDDNTGKQEGIFIWDYAKLIESTGWKMIRHIQIPLSTQQVHPDIVTKFRKSKRLARLERYLIIATT